MLSRSALCAALLLAAGSVFAQGAGSSVFGPPAPGEPILTAIQVPNLPLGVVTFPNGKAMNLTVALGSGAFRAPSEPAGRFWLVTDRGPAIACADAKRVIGMEPEAACEGKREGGIYPLPGFVPSLYGAEIGPDFATRITAVLPLKGRSGRPVSGRPGPKAGPVFGADGKSLPPDPSGVDPEALVRLADGSFWLADTYGPSLLEVASDGTVRRRLVPANAAEDFKDADYEIVPVLPAQLRARRAGQGFRALALSPDEQFLYVAMQSPLSLPDEASGRASRHLRLYKIARASGQVVAQFLYALEPAESFPESEGKPRAQADVRVVEMAAVGLDKLILLEQIDKVSRFFLVSLEDASRIDPALDAPEARLPVEVMDAAALMARGLRPMVKSLVLDSEKLAGLPARIEAFAILSPSEIVAINDNDFGIDGARTQMFTIALPALAPEKVKDEPAGSGQKK